MRLIFVALVTTLILGSCCSKENCIVNGTQVKIYGFSDNDLDSVVVRAHLRDIRQEAATDSFFYTATRENDYHTIPFRSFVEDREYTIEIVKANRTFLITNIAAKEESCGSCNKQRTVYEQLEYYHVDGEIIRKDEIVLQK